MNDVRPDGSMAREDGITTATLALGKRCMRLAKG